MLSLRRLRLEGFKALDGFETEISDNVLFLIGANGAGKSSVLQAIAFARAYADGNCSSFFEDRHWQARDLYPKIRRLEDDNASNGRVGGIRRRVRSRPVRMSFLLENRRRKIFWEFAWSSTVEKTLTEELWVRDGRDEPRRIWSYDSARVTRSEELGVFSFMDLRINGSMTAYLKSSYFDSDADATAFEDFRRWCEGITSLELLSPVAMRRGVRGSPKDIGARGERLTGFLASLPADRRSTIVERLAQFYPLEALDTTRKRAGWIDMQVSELYKGIGTIRPAHLSDGFFRLLALSSIPEFGPDVSLILLDEIEDGIEPHILPKIIKRIASETSAQLIMTSHSPLLINNFKPNQIAFLARDDRGRTLVARPDEIDTFRRGSEYFGSGEIWVNNDAQRLTRSVLRSASGQDAARGSSIEGTAVRATQFLMSRP